MKETVYNNNIHKDMSPLDYEIDPIFIPDVSPDDVDLLVAKEMSGLSMEERERVYHDVHGVSDVIEETPELIRSALDQMEVELGKLKDAVAYEMALEVAPAYIRDKDLRLRFLWAEVFNAKKAAERFALYFEFKLDLFGKEKLGKEITQDDLSEDALRGLYSGASQILPLRDRSGRIVQIRFVQSPDIDLRANLMISFYNCTVLSEDRETQKLGAVSVAFTHKQAHLLSRQKGTKAWETPVISSAVPIRFVGVHYAHDSKLIWAPFVAQTKKLLNESSRVRVREHFGTHQECLFSLQTYGIPVAGCFPFSEEGKILTDYHHEYLKKRRNVELMRESKIPGGVSTVPDGERNVSHTITIPSQFDVLLGRGKRFYEHPGNVRLRFWVDERVQDYDRALTAQDKKNISCAVVDLVKGVGGRFLKDDNFAGWVEVDHETARLKVSHAFRNIRALKLAACSPPKDDCGAKRTRDG